VQYDQLIIDGDILLDGLLIVTKDNGFEPDEDDAFNVLTWTGTITGTFSEMSMPTLNANLYWITENIYTTGQISVGHFDRDRDGVPNLKDAYPDDIAKVSDIPSDLSAIATNIEVWFNAASENAVTTSDAGTVTDMYDFSGNQHHVSQNVVASRPEFGTRVENGLTVLDFVSSDSLSSALFPTALTQAYSVAIVLKRDVTTGAKYVLDGLSSGASVAVYQESSTYKANAGTVQSGGTVKSDTEMIFIDVNGGSSTHYVDALSTFTGDLGSRTFSGLTLGTDFAGLNGFDGFVAELLVFDKSLSATERLSVENYLGNKWAVTKVADRDFDGHRDFYDAYPTDNSKSTPNIEFLSPDAASVFDPGTRSVIITLNLTVEEDFSGYLAYTLNKDFDQSNVQTFGVTTNQEGVVTFDITTVDNASYIFRFGLVETDYSVVTSADISELRFSVDEPTVVSGAKPTDIDGLTLWLDSNDVSSFTKDASERIATWLDRSGSGNHAVQSGADSLKPLYSAVASSGLPAVVFDGSNDYLTVGTESNFDDFVFTAFYVVHAPSNTPWGSIMAKGGSANGWMTRFHSSQDYVSFRSSSFSPLNSEGSRSIVGQTRIIAIQYDGVNLNMYEDGHSVQELSPDASLLMNDFDLVLGARNDGSVSDYSNIYVSEVLMYDNAISSSNRRIMENFLAGKWNISSTQLTPYTVPADVYSIDFGLTETYSTNKSIVTRNLEIARHDEGRLILNAGATVTNLDATLGIKDFTSANVYINTDTSLWFLMAMFY
jgi:hypothetical protein